MQGIYLLEKLQYICKQCGWRWTREVKCPAKIQITRPILVDACPGCV